MKKQTMKERNFGMEMFFPQDENACIERLNSDIEHLEGSIETGQEKIEEMKRRLKMLEGRNPSNMIMGFSEDHWNSWMGKAIERLSEIGHVEIIEKVTT